MSDSHLKRQRVLPSNIRAFIFELEERFGCTFVNVADSLFSAALVPSRALVEFAPQAGLLRISTPLRGADRALSADRAFGMLVRNFPNEALSGAGIRDGLADDSLEIFHEVALKMLSVDGVAAYVSDHAYAAQAFDRWLSSNRFRPVRQTPLLEMAEA